MDEDKLLLLKKKCEFFNRFLIDYCGMPAQLMTGVNELLDKASRDGDLKVLEAGS